MTSFCFLYTFPGRVLPELVQLLAEQATPQHMAGFGDRASRVPYHLEDMWISSSSPLGASEASAVMYAEHTLQGADLMDYYRPMAEYKNDWSNWWNPRIQAIMKQSTSRVVLEGTQKVVEHVDRDLLDSQLRRTTPERNCSLEIFTSSTPVGSEILRQAMYGLHAGNESDSNRAQDNKHSYDQDLRQQGIIQITVMAQLEINDQPIVIVRTESLPPSCVKVAMGEMDPRKLAVPEPEGLPAEIESTLASLRNHPDIRVHNTYAAHFVYLQGVDAEVLVETTDKTRNKF